MTEFGSQLILNGDVKYVGEGEDPGENPYMKAYARALKEVYRPDRLNPEDHIPDIGNMVCDSQNCDHK